MSDIEKRALELLADGYAAMGWPHLGEDVRSGAASIEPHILHAITAALTPPEGYVPERAMLRVATGLREKASRSARPLERKTLIASAEALEKAVSAARPEVQS